MVFKPCSPIVRYLDLVGNMGTWTLREGKAKYRKAKRQGHPTAATGAPEGRSRRHVGA